MEWEKIGVGIIAIAAIVIFFPAIFKGGKEKKQKASKQDWMGALIPIGLVVLFVVFLIMSVR